MEILFIDVEAAASGFHTGYYGTAKAFDAAGNEVEPVSYIRDGQAVLPPSERAVYTEAKGQVSFDIEEQSVSAWTGFQDGRSVPTATYPVAVRLVNCYKPPAPPAPEPAAQLRQRAYETERLIHWPNEGTLLTVTEAAQQWQYYAAEGSAGKAEALTALIAAAKEDIRGRYPDGASDSDAGKEA